MAGGGRHGRRGLDEAGAPGRLLWLWLLLLRAR